MSRFPSSLGRKFSRARLAWAFIGLGVLLLGTLGTLSIMAHQRLTEARHEREEMVASRIFDEMEREISAFLDLEYERPHYSALLQTNPETWAPFVVGYFSGAGINRTDFARVVVAEGRTSEHRRRMNWALERASETWASSSAPATGTPKGSASSPFAEPPTVYQVAPTPERHSLPQETLPQSKDLKVEKPAPAASGSKPSSDREIIESLNRAPERRKSSASPPSKAEANDPFSDYSRAY